MRETSDLDVMRVIKLGEDCSSRLFGLWNESSISRG